MYVRVRLQADRDMYVCPPEADHDWKVSRPAVRGRERASTPRCSRDRSVRNAAARCGARNDAARTCRRPGRTNEGNDRGNSDRPQPCGRRRVGADVSGRSRRARPQSGCTRHRRAVRMRQRDGAGTQAGEQQERDTSTLNPRRTAEHRIQLSDRAVLRQALADWQIGRWADW